MKHTPFLSHLLVGSLTMAGLAFAQTADNTKVNKRDKEASSRQSTPENATSTKKDLETLRKIRRAITSDKSLSTYAHNVKITVKNGQTTLRGPVNSTSEKTRLEDLAKRNGATSVTNELEIATSSSK